MKRSKGDIGIGSIQVEESSVEGSYGSHALYGNEDEEKRRGRKANLVLCTLGI